MEQAAWSRRFRTHPGRFEEEPPSQPEDLASAAGAGSDREACLGGFGCRERETADPSASLLMTNRDWGVECCVSHSSPKTGLEWGTPTFVAGAGGRVIAPLTCHRQVGSSHGTPGEGGGRSGGGAPSQP